MSALQEIHITPEPLERFVPMLGMDRVREAEQVIVDTGRRLRGHVWWNVSSTARGGGVAEMLPSLLAYARDAGIDARWPVISATPAFFAVTKRLHHALHGSAGDGSPLDEAARAVYEDALHANAEDLLGLVQPGDIALLHDPQTAGLAPALIERGAHVLWRCHIGTGVPNEETRVGWEFLAPYLSGVDATIFSSAAFVPASVALGRIAIIPPSIDPFTPKNQELDEQTVRGVLAHTGLVETTAPGPATFTRADGTAGRVDRQADVLRRGPAPQWDTPLVVQVSRWDPLKDPVGVLQGFAALMDGHAPHGAELVLAGPDVSAVTDDPEGAATYEAVRAAWSALPESVRAHIHLASLPMDDLEENAAIVNALQRHATVIVQKSLHEGFGLTVTEAMWKGKPIVASAIGGIRDQIVDGEHGLLLPDPTDLDTLGELLHRLLTDAPLAARLGKNAHLRARERYLGVRHLLQYADLFAAIDADGDHASAPEHDREVSLVGATARPV